MLLIMFERLLGRLQFAQGFFPTPFQLAGHQPILGIGVHELTFGKLCLITQAIDFLATGGEHLVALAVGMASDILRDFLKEAKEKGVEIEDGTRRKCCVTYNEILTNHSLPTSTHTGADHNKFPSACVILTK